MRRIFSILLCGLLGFGAGCVQESGSDIEEMTIALNLVGALKEDGCTTSGQIPADPALDGTVDVVLGGGYWKYKSKFIDNYEGLFWINGKIQSSQVAGARAISKLHQEWQGYYSFCPYLSPCLADSLSDSGRVNLTNWGTASDIVVYGDDVYIIGSRDPDGFPLAYFPGYWKNNVWTPLPLLPGATNGLAFAMEPAENSIYISGSQYVSGTGLLYGYWKDGFWNTVPESHTGISVWDGKVYTGGGNSIYENGIYYFRGNTTVQFQSFRIRNGDLYATARKNGKWGYFVNGEFTAVTDCGNAIPRDFFVLDSDIYIAGSNGGSPGYWKNRHWNAVESFQTSPTHAWSIYVENK